MRWHLYKSQVSNISLRKYLIYRNGKLINTKHMSDEEPIKKTVPMKLNYENLINELGESGAKRFDRHS